MLGMLLVAASIIDHGVRRKTSGTELSVWLGVIAVYVMFTFRLGAPERSHIIEYSVLTIFVYKALLERALHTRLFMPAYLLTLVMVVAAGVVDEWIQKWLPGRVFDSQDIVFNILAVLMALGASSLLTWTRNRLDASK